MRSLPPVAWQHGVGQHLAHRARYSPNVRATSRILSPSTITARRTRRYTSTVYIRRTISRVGYDPYGWRQTVQFATAECPVITARTEQFTSAVDNGHLS